MKLPWYKEALGYLFPIKIQSFSNKIHSSLVLKRYQGQWLLESGKALYSEGNSYKPFVLAYNHIQQELSSINTFLLLGCGLGSALKILQDKYKLNPQATLIEIDQDILTLVQEIPTLSNSKKVQCLNLKAEDFLKENKFTYDLIGVDLFHEMSLAPIVYSGDFLAQIKIAMHSSSIAIINTIFQLKEEVTAYENKLKSLFLVDKINYAPNYIYILRLPN